jgi:NAD(P)-dependent dehydrogenase (short-subunit alcohol dehydrogenase family)
VTPGLKGLTGSETEWQKMQANLIAQIPLGRIADPREIGRAAVFLASDDASFVNGVELFVDGGMAQI